MHILLVGEFPGKDKLVTELSKHRHYVAVATNADSALQMIDESEAPFGLVIVPQGSSAKWMGTVITVGLKARLLRKAVIFVVTAEDDSMDLLQMQIQLQIDGFVVLAMHPPLFFDFIADQLQPVGVNLFNIQ